jgi:hypothetical protein
MWRLSPFPFPGARISPYLYPPDPHDFFDFRYPVCAPGNKYFPGPISAQLQSQKQFLHDCFACKSPFCNRLRFTTGA